ncbi:hypothetical protein BOTBODRAFT_588878 [Botryobasidium botryosum FD-172 SS1]|uniref:Uncharacterized protein n=1 Tax=Botryobasidium botryosum (strain FD-172 SS1) TaxID=930990 RepID=A0A067LX26_BOTB1|nr:hypothetical protein BOTBODRAFT_588878 [Botryobasidium botryosum FD-172 SS1]
MADRKRYELKSDAIRQLISIRRHILFFISSELLLLLLLCSSLEFSPGTISKIRLYLKSLASTSHSKCGTKELRWHL